jgi:hypothetical protein
MQKVCIDMPSLLLAWQDESPDNLYYMDTLSGAIKLVHKHLFDLRDLTDEIEKNRERFLYIPKPDRAVERKDLRSFMDQVQAKELLPMLDVAFESPHILSAFRKILQAQPAELANLESYRADLLTARINEWLAANGFAHDPKHINSFDRLADDETDFNHNDDEADERSTEDYEDEERIKGKDDFSPRR